MTHQTFQLDKLTQLTVQQLKSEVVLELNVGDVVKYYYSLSPEQASQFSYALHDASMSALHNTLKEMNDE